MTTLMQNDRSLTPVQEILARGVDSKPAPISDREPDAWLRLSLDADEWGRWSATLFGPALDRTAADALTVPLGESARLFAVAAARARRALVVHTTDEHGVRYVDMFDPPPYDVHQVPPSAVDAAANADAIRSGLSPAVWTPDRVVWSPIALEGCSRRPLTAGKAVAVGVGLVATVAAVGLALAVPVRASTDDPGLCQPKTYEPSGVDEPALACPRVEDRSEPRGGEGVHG